jgi:hypothetical protein
MTVLRQKTQTFAVLLHKNRRLAYFFFLINVISNEGSNTRFVIVAVTRVRDVSQPRD